MSKKKRKCGVLLPVFSLPSPYGIGAFSKEAYEFVNFLCKAGQSYWQILPLGPTGYGDSPYQSFSTFAGNPYYIDLEKMIQKGYVTKEDCEENCNAGDGRCVNYDNLYLTRWKILRKAYENSNILNDTKFINFIEENKMWLFDYALFMSIKDSYGGKSFYEWDEDIRRHEPAAVSKYAKLYKEEINFYQFLQYEFWIQWQELKEYANKQGIEIIGDIPIYVALDSADVWANPSLFQLDESGNPLAVAGCPPDAFSKDGQLWGNPLYNWEYHKDTGYVWWIQRMSYCYRLYDVVRIDHFRGFDEYYAIPFGDKDAKCGKWKKGPGYDIFRTLKNQLGEKPVIAEDLGFLTESVIELVRKTGYPGMKVLQFAFDSREDSDYLPHNYDKNCVVYTGTHDNDTVLGWYNSLEKRDKEFANEYLNIKENDDIARVFIKEALASVADTAIIPLQDYLRLGSESRINLPSSVGTNWRWRCLPGEHNGELAEEMYKTAKIYGRVQ
ncbi:MAG: 4-alpha-glucanotransferase [Lachnospiraceae bacterium]|nr:4-alpha-glucanotransferase [Lachnospiraceae bacterium]